jgi:endoglucanase
VQPSAEPGAAEAANRRLGRGVNLGNALEAPREGEWGVTLEAGYFDQIRRAGFRTVRIPTRWSAHAAVAPPYTIDSTFFARIDWAVEQALSRGLNAVLNVHHYEEMDKDPERHRPRLIEIWRQIAKRYRDRPEGLVFELMNEPHDELTPARWQEIFPQALAAVRETNPRRIVIIGPGNWNNVDTLAQLKLPENDRRLVGTFHYYNPFRFTHQEAGWVQGSAAWKGTRWTGSPEEVAAVRRDFDKAAAWAREQKRPLFLGEFGAYSRADMPSREQWTRTIAREAEQRGFSWAYWEFCAGFGVYDRDTGSWRQPLLQALLPPSPPAGDR